MIVASFYAYRYDKWGVDYIPLLQLLDASCARFGLRHVVIGDEPVPGLDTAVYALPRELMTAILDGQRQFLADAREPVLLVGADCLLARDPRPVLAGDMTVTIGPFADCEMNTGAIWCADGRRCAPVWQAALDRNPLLWGEDQTSLYASIEASDLDVTKVRCETHNWAPDTLSDDAGKPTVVHFRGKRKTWMAQWAERHLGLAPPEVAA